MCDPEQGQPVRASVSSYEKWGEHDLPAQVSAGIKRSDARRSRAMEPGTRRALGKRKQPAATPSCAPPPRGVETLSLAPRPHSCVPKCWMLPSQETGRILPPLRVPQAWAASWLPAPPQGPAEKNPARGHCGQAGCVALSKSVPLSGPLSCSHPGLRWGWEMRK